MAEPINFRIQLREGDPERGAVFVKCERPPTGECRFPFWRKPAIAATWNWDGNAERPTIAPSIECLGGCGRHFSIIGGDVV